MAVKQVSEGNILHPSLLNYHLARLPMFVCQHLNLYFFDNKQDKARTFLLREKEFESEISSGSSENEEATTEEKISAFESLLMDCKDAIQVKLL